MSKFAEYKPDRPYGVTRAPIAIREAGPDDAVAVARLAAERDGGHYDEILASVRKQIATDDRHIFVAELDDAIVGYGRISKLDASTIPEGWYLTGMIVAPAHRRRGIGRALTEHRLRWLATRTAAVYYFSNVRNRVSIALHAALGFREIDRGITVPGCTFTGGVGALFVCELPR